MKTVDTKFNRLKMFLATKKTFKFGEVNKRFKTTGLNSYTTYLNTLRHAGVIEQIEGVGMYRVVDKKRLQSISLSDAQLIFKNNRLKKDLKSEAEWNRRLQKEIAQLRSDKKVLTAEMDHMKQIIQQYQLSTPVVDPVVQAVKNLGPMRDRVDEVVERILISSYDAPPHELFGQKDELITLESLGLDSLDAVEFLMALEEEFELDIADDDAEKAFRSNLKAVKDLVRNMVNGKPTRSGAV